MRMTADQLRGGRPIAILAAIALITALVPLLPGSVGPAFATMPTLYDDIYVDVAADGPGDGSAEDPFLTITQALAVAGEGAHIMVAPGEYTSESGEIFPLAVPSGVTVEGTFDTEMGWQTTVMGEPMSSAPLVVITEAEAVTIKGISFMQNEYAGGLQAQSLVPFGAGVSVFASEVRIANCAFVDLISFAGSALYAEDSVVEIQGSIFAFNGEATGPFEVSAEDVAKLDEYGFGELSRAASELRSQYTATESAYGGAILSVFSDMSVLNSAFGFNGASTAGGAILNVYGTLSTTGSLFVENGTAEVYPDEIVSAQEFDELRAQVDEGPYGGGAISNYAGYYRGLGCEYTSNYSELGAAVSGAGGETELSGSFFGAHWGPTVVATEEGLMPAALAFGALDLSAQDVPEPDFGLSLDIDACEFWENEGIFTTYSELADSRITNSLYAHNYSLATVMLSGGVSGTELVEPPVIESGPSVEGCTIVENSIDWAAVVGGEMLPASVFNTIIWANTGMAADYVNMWNCDIDDGFGANEIGEANALWYDDTVISEDPLFMSAIDGDFRLAPDSPCVDTGTDEAPADVTLTYDVRPWDITSMKRPVDGDDDGDAANDMGAFEYQPSARIGGINRYGTSAMIAQQYFGAADTVVLATALKFPDALSGSGLAGAYRAPILITRPDMLSAEAASEIERLGARRVIILGSEMAIDSNVEAELADMGLEVIRIGGADRYETSALITEYMLDSGLRMFDSTMAFVARGDRFPDALAASPIAWANRMPVLLVKPDQLPENTVDVLYTMGVTSAAIIGSEAAVSDAVAQDIKAMGISSERIGGDDRYETAALVAEWAYDNGYATFDSVGIATGLTFPDALAGGAGLGSINGVILLTPMDALDPACEAAIGSHAEEIDLVHVFGSTAAVRQSVYDSVMSILSGR